MAQEITQMYSSAVLAFLGDSVYEINIRSRIIREFKGNAGSLNSRAKALTNAKAQSQMVEALKDVFTEEETAVYKRGRNFKSPSVPRSCSVGEYRRATGLEALMGYLFILGRQERIDELISTGIELLNEQKNENGT